MSIEQATAHDVFSAVLSKSQRFAEQARPIGQYTFVCHSADGKLLWVAEAPNMIVDAGVQYLLNGIAAATTIVGPFMGLMGGAGTVAAADTMASHAGWTEVGGTNAPAYGGNRLQPTWGAAAGRSKAITGTNQYTFSSGGTVVGAFMVLSTGALSTKDNTGGVLYSAGTFASQTVASSNILSVTYTTTLT